ncbi:hypothetical protein F5144DRAFT_591404 [Chaetomium tenue]|uniref:Uncharacterized protein n=1 Tax=Chaetomium tenue TaxID=1854479 RepID=A0ACB7PCY3_9PEZI|nr:hypothetical protein F5144DRAFT_591404 [Chaetomium globosum]
MALSPAPHDRPTYGSDLPPSSSTSPSAHRTAPAPPPPPPPAPSVPKCRRTENNCEEGTRNTSIVSPATGRPLTARDGLGIQEVGIACLSPGFVPKDAAEQEQLNRSMNLKDQQQQLIKSRLHQSTKPGDGPDKDKETGHFAAKTPGFARKRGAPPGLSIVAPSHEQFANERVIQSAPLGQTFTGRHNPHPLTRHITNQPSNLASTSHIHHVQATQTNNRLPPIADVFGQGLSGHPESSGHAMFANQSRAPLPSPHHPPMPQSARSREYKSAEEAQAELAGGRPELLPKLVRYGGHQPPTPPSPPQAPRDYPQNQHNSNSHNHNHNQHHQNHTHYGPPPTHADSALAITSSRAPNHNHQAPHPGPGPSSPMGSNSMKRRRAEYEEGSPPLGNGGRPAPAAPQPHQHHPPHHPPHQSHQSIPLPFGVDAPPPNARRGLFGEGRDSPETIEAKKKEFMSLCSRAWDLIHS